MLVIFAFSSIHGSGSPYASPLWFVLERKGAHVVEYLILALLALCFLSSYRERGRMRRFLYGIVSCFCIAYAFSDEIHQFFVFGREARFTDVLIDFIGASIGMMVFFFWREKKSPR